MILLDEDNTNVYDDTFSADAMYPDDPFARRPAVEVTYERSMVSSTGIVRVHVVWAELVEGGMMLDDHWDLYYRMYTWVVTFLGNGVNWANPTSIETVKLPCSTLTRDEIQPDLAVCPSTNDLFVIYLEQSDSQDDVIKADRHLYAEINDLDDWEGSDQVNDGNSRAKWCPTIDVGRISGIVATQHTHGNVVAAWSECTSVVNEDIYFYNIFYNDWDPFGTPTSSNTEQISESGEGGYTSNYLPQIDITPRSSQLHEGVITWSTATLDTEEEVFVNFHVAITATPYMDSYISLPNGTYSTCADVAAYQMTGTTHDFVISYYYDDSPDFDDLDIYIQRFGLTMNYGNETFDFEPANDTGLDADCRWVPENPFTGSTVCLRIPDDTYQSQTYFGLGWIDSSSYNVKLTDGQV